MYMDGRMDGWMDVPAVWPYCLYFWQRFELLWGAGASC